MADNTQLNQNTTPGDNIATLDVAGIKHEKVISEFLVGGVPQMVDAANPLPVTDAASEAALTSIAAEDFATSAKQSDGSQKSQIVDAGGEAATVTGGKLDVNASVDTTGLALAANQQNDALTDTQLRATPVPVSGTLTVNEPVTVDATDLDIRNLVFATDKVDASGSTGVGVTGTFFQATQPVSAAALPLPTGAATAANQQTDALTDTELRATPVPVSGTVTVNEPVTVDAVDLDIRNLVFATDKADVSGSTGVGVTGTFFQATQPVSATNLDIRDLTFAADKIDASGTVLGAGVNNIGDVDVLSLPSIPAGTNNIGDVDVLSLPALPAGNNNIGDVDIASIAAGDNNIGNVDVVTLPALVASSAIIGNVRIDQTTHGTTNAVSATGNVAHDTADAGNPVKVGMKAIALGSNPTGVTANDRTDWYANRAGIPFMLGGHPNIICLRATYTAAQTDTKIITISAGSKIVVTRITVTASAANTVNPSVIIGFAATTTPTTTGVVLSHPGVAPGSGVVEGNGAGILGVGADGEDLIITSGVPTSGAIDVVVSYFTIES